MPASAAPTELRAAAFAAALACVGADAVSRLRDTEVLVTVE